MRRIFAAFMLCIVSGCTMEASQTRTLGNGRAITVSGSATVTWNSEKETEDSAEMSVGNIKFYITPDSVNHDGVKITDIPEEAKQVSIQVDGSNVTVSADELEVFSGKIPQTD